MSYRVPIKIEAVVENTMKEVVEALDKLSIVDIKITASVKESPND